MAVVKGVTSEKRSERCNIAGFEHGRRGNKPRNTGGFWKLERAREWILPESPEKSATPSTLGF